MGTIFVVSPNYLSAVFQESQKYSFDIQGYGNFEDAYSRLTFVNSIDLLGFLFIGDSLPMEGTEEYNQFLHFLKRANLIRPSKKFLLVLKNQPKDYTVFKKYENLRFAVNLIEDSVTDVVINKLAFGSILLDNFPQYNLENEEPRDLTGIESNPLHLESVIDAVYWEILAPVHLVDDLERSLEFDAVYQRYQSTWVGLVRSLVIAKKIGVDTTRIEKSIRNALNEMEGKQFGLVYTLVEIIKNNEEF